MPRFIRYVTIGVLILAAVPTFAGAAEKFKDVLIVNTPEDPVPVEGVGTQQVSGDVQVSGNVQVSNLPATQQVSGRVEVSNLPAVQRLRHGDGVASDDPRQDVIFPNDLILTDLVITRIDGSTRPACEVALFEDRGEAELSGIQFFYPTRESPTVELHFESGLMLGDGAESWGVVANSQECALKVLWSGYTRP